MTVPAMHNSRRSSYNNPYQSPNESSDPTPRVPGKLLSLERMLVLATFASLLILNVAFDDRTTAAVLTGVVLFGSVVAMTIVVLFRRG
ncbi:MAG: hypothetical protein KF708_10860 [Pirellulales bacterium]|nr:hypothetical protein [Pirellulales bacterium]